MELNRDGDGFLINTSDWSEEVMNQMATDDNFEITEEIKTYIDKAREMYNASGPMKKIAKYGGLPKPTGCV